MPINQIDYLTSNSKNINSITKEEIKNNSLDSFFNITEKILGAGKLGDIG